MKILHITVADKIASFLKREGGIVCGNSDYKISFTFDAEWDAHDEKTARFIWGGQYFDQEFTGTECEVPVIMKAERVEVGVYAGDLKSTTNAVIPCTPSVLSGSETPNPGTGQHYSNEAQAAAAAARASETNAAASEAEAQTAAQEAQTSAQEARTTATEVCAPLAARITEIEEHLAPKYIITDDKTAYRKDVPANACSKAQLNSIGGMTYIDETTNTFVDAKVTELKLRGANIIGGVALADSMANSMSGAVKDNQNKTINFSSGQAKLWEFADVKPNTQYTVILYGRNTKATTNVTNIRIAYTDGTNSDLKFNSMGENSYEIKVSTSGKSVEKICGVTGSGTTVLYYDKCGIFEGNISIDEFQPYEEKTIFQIPAEIQALPNYGKMFTEVDLVNKKFIDDYAEMDGVVSWNENPVSVFEIWGDDPNNLIEGYDCSVQFMRSDLNDAGNIGPVITEKPYDSIEYVGTQFILRKRVAQLNSFGSNDNYEIAEELFGKVTIVAKHYAATEHDVNLDNIIKVTAGGAIEFVNNDKKAVPSSVSYMMGGHLFEGV